jgi:hypothetical protein
MSMARNMLRILLPAAAAVALLTGAAYAQSPIMPKFSIGNDEKRKLTPEEQARQDELDKAYKSATNKIPDKKAGNDPWAAVRPSASAPAVKKKQQ